MNRKKQSIQRNPFEEFMQRTKSAQAAVPQNLDAERGALCSCLMDPARAISVCLDELTELHFYHPPHQILYRAIIDLWTVSKTMEFITVAEFLDKQGLLLAAGGAAYISTLYTFLPTGGNIEYYIEIVKEKYLLREMLSTCHKFAQMAFTEQANPRGLADEFQKAAMDLQRVHETKAKTERLKDLVKPALDRYEAAFKKKDKSSMTGLTTGFARLDTMTGGMLAEQMIVIAAREKLGKSALAFNIAVHVSSIGYGVGVLSLEMSKRQLIDRYFAMRARVDLRKIRDGAFCLNDTHKLYKAAADAAKAPIWVRDESSVNALQIRATAQNLVEQHQIKLLIVDYAQLIEPLDRREVNRERQVAEISRNLKVCAKELRIPVIVISQVNSDGETRESKALQQDCDQLWKVVTEKRKKPKKQNWKSKKQQDEDDEEEDQSEEEDSPVRPCFLHVEYNREGPTGFIPMNFLRTMTVFEERNDNPY